MSATIDSIWAQNYLEPNAVWDAVLRNRGASAVRRLLETSPGRGAGAAITGLGNGADDQPLRAYVENWLDKQDTVKEARKERRENRRQMLTWSIAILAVCVGAGSIASNIYKACPIAPGMVHTQPIVGTL